MQRRHKVKDLKRLYQGFIISAVALVAVLLLPGMGNASSGWYAEYFANRNLSGAPVVVRQDEKIDFNWGTGSPAAQVPVDNFSARWTQTIHFEEGYYEFSVGADDGVRLFVDGKIVIDDWRDTAHTTRRSSIHVPAGPRTVRLEYYEATGQAAVRLTWERKAIVRPIGNIVTWAEPGTWVRVYRRMPDNTWQLMNPGGTGPIDASGRIKIDGLPVEFVYGNKGQPYRVEIWEQGRMLRSVGNTSAGQAEWLLFPFRDNFTPWGPPAAAPAPVPAPTPTPTPAPKPGQGGTVQPYTGTVVNAAHLNVRRGPGPKTAAVTTVSRNQVVQLTGFRNANGTWIQIQANGVTGWVNAYYIRTNVAVHTLAVAR
jgi:hypothetical protein